MKISNFCIFITLTVWINQSVFSQSNRDVNITIHLRGVYESKISLMSNIGSPSFKTLQEVTGVKNGQTKVLTVDRKNLPGEFLLRLEYREKAGSQPYPVEKYIFINLQNLELWIRPQFINNPDSTWFQKDELENNTYQRFITENGDKKEKLGILQNFLMSYDDTDSKVYKEAVKEYEKRRIDFHNWLNLRKEQDKNLFISHLYNLQYIPSVPWTGTENDRIQSLMSQFFDGIDFHDTLILRTATISKWMDSYVNLYAQLSVTATLRDSLLSLAGHNAIEKAKTGHPLFYGWMVDYFFRGYEANNIPAGMKVLKPYLDDPNCLTTQRKEINRRLQGMETLKAGTTAPDISLKDQKGNLFELYKYNPDNQYILLVFWSADCSHCSETVDALYPLLQKPELAGKYSVVAVSLDETETEVEKWEQKIATLEDWKHIRPPDGVRSKVATDYFILATPVMIIMDPKTKEILATPRNVGDIAAFRKL